MSRSLYLKKAKVTFFSLAAYFSYSGLLQAQDAVSNSEAMQNCFQNILLTGDDSLTLKQIRQTCEEKVASAAKNDDAQEDVEVSKIMGVVSTDKQPGLISNRLIREHQSEFLPYAITPHKLNYILPALTTNKINTAPYEGFANGYAENFEDLEAKFQISLKVPLNHGDMFIEGDGIYLGFTLQAWWQIYSSNISKPFRETNYQPELFYFAPLNWNLFGGDTGFIVGMEHQSNGRNQLLSRSWNRFYTTFLFEKDNFALSLRPWYRLSEDEKEFALDPSGDDNPDIEDFMGHFELGLAYKWNDIEFTYSGRQNFDTGNGSSEFGVVFPIFGKIKGYANAFNGYGDSLIDYNHRQTRFGIGIAFNNPL